MNETHYDPGTPQRIIEVMEAIMHDQAKRVRLFFGDARTGRDWMEEYEVTGYIGRSGGTQHIPLLISSTRSLGGPAISTSCIVRMLVNGREVYRHPRYHTASGWLIRSSRLATYVADVWAIWPGEKNARVQARFHSMDSAKRWILFMKGERMSK